MFISGLQAAFRTLNIQVDIDPALLPHLDTDDKVTRQRIIPLNLFKLIYAIGSIQTRRNAPSWRQKFSDKSDLIERINSLDREFRVYINDIRRNVGSEGLKTISEDFGVGVSVLVAKSLFNIRPETIQRIYSTGKRPDWECQMVDNRKLIVESKGASSQATSDDQEDNAVIQKNKRAGDVKVASLTLIKEDQISVCRFVDPPINPGNMSAEEENRILRAGHYASVFSFLGHSELSRYFSQMRKRLMNQLPASEQDRKDNVYRKIRDTYKRVEFAGNEFAGTFYNIGDRKYLFIGVDLRLISYQGFLDFSNYGDDLERDVSDNHYFRYQDGILIIEIRNINAFAETVRVNEIQNYQERNTLSDIDEMSEISFRKYLIYALEKYGFQVREEVVEGNTRIDMIATLGEQRFLFEIKLFRDKKKASFEMDGLFRLNARLSSGRLVLVTNIEMSMEQSQSSNELVVIDRTKLRLIVRDNRVLRDLLLTS